jgi:hypothetical protein
MDPAMGLLRMDVTASIGACVVRQVDAAADAVDVRVVGLCNDGRHDAVEVGGR